MLEYTWALRGQTHGIVDAVHNHGNRRPLMHSDDPTQRSIRSFRLGCACNRKSGISGKVYGEDQCLTADEAQCAYITPMPPGCCI